MGDIEDILHEAICDYRAGFSVHLTDLILARLRANGYVIKRAVPPCRGHDFEEHNDAA